MINDTRRMLKPSIKGSRAGQSAHTNAQVRQLLRTAAATIVLSGLMNVPAHASDATWNGTTPNWNLNSNWLPATVPDDIARFKASGVPNVSILAPTDIGTIDFATDAKQFDFSIRARLNVFGGGINNRSNELQSFRLSDGAEMSLSNSARINGAGVQVTTDANSRLSFRDNSSAGAAEISNDGATLFTDNARAGSASILNNDGSQTAFAGNSSAEKAVIENSAGSALGFGNKSTAAGANITNDGAITEFLGTSSAGKSSITNIGGGDVNFRENATAASSNIDNQSGRVIFRDAAKAGLSLIQNGFFSSILFIDKSSADKAHIVNDAGFLQFQNESTAGNAVIDTSFLMGFFNKSTAGNAQINVNSGALLFQDDSTAGNSDIVGSGGVTVFTHNSSAAKSSIINAPGSGLSALIFRGSATADKALIDNSASLSFQDNSTAGEAQITNHGAGTAEFKAEASAGRATIANADDAGTIFRENSTAAEAKIFNDGDAFTAFEGNAKAGQAEITNDVGGSTFFAGDSSADEATITNENGGTTTFQDNAVAGNAFIFNGGGEYVAFDDASSAANADIVNSNESTVEFKADSTAGDARIFNEGGSAAFFSDRASAGNAKIINEANTATFFEDAATGGSATIFNHAGGLTDISGVTSGGLSVGAISGAGDISLGANNLTTGANNSDDVIAGMIYDNADGASEGGSLTKVGAGTLTLQGTHYYSGDTNINAGALQLEGTLQSKTIVGANGALVVNGTRDIHNDVVNNGRLALSTEQNPFGVLRVSGNFATGHNSLFETQADATGRIAFVEAETASLGGGRVRVQAQPGFYLMRTQLGIVKTTDGLSGTFQGIDDASTLPDYLQASLLYDAKNAYLLLRRTRTDFRLGTGLSDNARAFAKSLDAGAENASDALTPLYDALLLAGNESPARLQQALSLSSGDAFAAIPMALQSTANRFSTQIGASSLLARGTNLSDDKSDGKQASRATAQRIAYNGNHYRSLLAQAGDDVAPSRVANRLATGMNWSAWGSIGGARDEADASNGGPGFNASSKDFRLGFDRTLNAHTLLGFAVGKSEGDVSVENRAMQGDLDTTSFGLYARHEKADWYASGQLSYDRHDIKSTRNLLAGGVARADYRARTMTVNGEVGKRLARGNLLIEPNVRLLLSKTRQDGFNETGGAGALQVGATGINSRRVGLGVRIAGRSEARVRPHLAVSYEREMGDNRADLSNRLPGLSAFRVQGADLGRNIFSLRLGAEVALQERLSLVGEVGGALRQNQNSRSVSGGIKYSW